jgi:hypothetical protein
LLWVSLYSVYTAIGIWLGVHGNMYVIMKF